MCSVFISGRGQAYIHFKYSSIFYCMPYPHTYFEIHQNYSFWCPVLGSVMAEAKSNCSDREGLEWATGYSKCKKYSRASGVRCVFTVFCVITLCARRGRQTFCTGSQSHLKWTFEWLLHKAASLISSHVLFLLHLHTSRT